MTTSADGSGPGVNVVGRAAAVLRAVAAAEPTGISTTDLARSAGLARPTAHRLLTALAAEDLVARDRSGLWSLGSELYLLSVGAAARYEVTGRVGPAVARLARETGESAFFSARRGDETVCVLAEEGSFPLRSHVLHVGIRFPLGVASAGLAILAHLPDADVDGYLARVRPEEGWGPAHAEPQIRARIAATRETGYAVNPGLIVEGSWGMAAAVFDGNGAPAWALSLTGVETRFKPERRRELGDLLLHQAHLLSGALQT
ncbi:MAG: IclR family transcriptional regulator [Mycolicibacterium insubricum]|nr:IclR family transcriptional regulator [Mycobacterium sp.]